MQICGLQKLTLLDYPGKAACTIFLGGCNFRCPFCQNAELIRPAFYSARIEKDTLMQFLDKRKKILDGVCITGGEPLLTAELADFIREIKAFGYAVKLDTNGTMPEKLQYLIEENLVDYVAMDIKNAPARYAETAGLPALDIRSVRESVKFLLSDAVDYEFRTTVVQELHAEEDFVEIGQWIQGAKRYFLQQFVDSEYVIKSGLHGYTKQELERFRTILSAYVPNTEIRGI